MKAIWGQRSTSCVSCGADSPPAEELILAIPAEARDTGGGRFPSQPGADGNPLADRSVKLSELQNRQKAQKLS